MKNTRRDKRSSAGSPWRRWLGGPLPLERETTLFVLVSALDVFMTYLLLRFSAEGRLPVTISESNPVARYFLYGWGIKGMVWFKFAVVAFVAVIAQLIALKNLETARWVLNVAIIVAAGVVIYSLALLLKHTGLL